MSHAPLRSILAKLPNPTAERGVEIEALKRRAWQERGEACINVRDPRLAWSERELLQSLARRLYGPSRALAPRAPQPRQVIE